MSKMQQSSQSSALSEALKLAREANAEAARLREEITNLRQYMVTQSDMVQSELRLMDINIDQRLKDPAKLTKSIIIAYMRDHGMLGGEE